MLLPPIYAGLRSRLTWTLTALFLLVMAPINTAMAQYSVQPLFVEMAPDAGGQRFEVRNGKQTPLAVEVSSILRTAGPDGQEVRADATDDLSIFPEQALIPAGGTQVFRLQYRGDRSIDTSRFYGAVVREVPADDPAAAADGANVKIVTTYIIGIAVTPTKGQSEVRVGDIKPVGNGTEITLHNDGSRHFFANSATWMITGDTGKTIDITSDKLGFLGFSIVQGKSSRTFSLPAELYQSVGAIKSISLAFPK
jgi:fimbrial chaperone protein